MRSSRVFAAAVVLLMSAAPAVAGAANVVVNTLSLAGWFGGNEGPGGSVGTIEFVPGPGTAPAGVGSAQLTVDSNGRASFGTAAFKGTAFSAISQLTFSAFVSSAGNPESPSLQLEVDYNSTDANTAYQGRLVYVPPTPVLDTWVSFDALGGTWWATGMPGQATCPQSSPCTWAQVLSAYPNAAIRNDPSQGGNLLFRLGGPIAGGETVNVDKFAITVGANSTTYDFEPGVAVNPSLGQPGTLVTIRAYGFKPQSTVKSYYYVSGTRGRKVLLCSATSSETGVFLCSVPLPTGTLAGLPGVHGVLVTGPRRIKYTPEIIITP